MSGKFRDKETGVEGYLRANREIEYQIEDERGVPINDSFKTLSELLEKWEEIDEEPKKFWYIEGDGDIHSIRTELCEELEIHTMKRIGNYFETKEEAEKAVEKLKAWKRLRDKGFRFDSYDVAHKSNGNLAGQIFYDAGNYSIEDVEKEMDLIFGGRE